MEDELDRMLSPQDEIVPSSGFAASVMEAVQHEAAASEPIPFPWLRALPVFVAMVAVVAMLVAGFVELAGMPAVATTEWTLPPAIEHALMQTNAGWIALALLVTLLSGLVSVRLAMGKR